MKSATGTLFDIRRYAIHDGPGIRTAVFFKGCPLDCWWCHNPESQAAVPELILHPGRCVHCGACQEACRYGANSSPGEEPVLDRAACQLCGECVAVCYAEGRQIVGREYALEEVLAVVERDRQFYQQSAGGVTFTGGEPLMQIDFLDALLTACKSLGLHTALDTSAFARRDCLERVREKVDLFLVDLKMIRDDLHQKFTGVSNRLILENLSYLADLGHAIWLRIPVIPGVNDDAANLRASARFAASLPAVARIDLLPYHASAEAKYRNLGRTYRLPGLQSPSVERMQEMARLMQEEYPFVHIGG